MKKIAFFITLCAILFTHIALAAGKQITINGVINVGTGAASIVDGDNEYPFDMNSKEANKIFKVCKANDKCTVTAIVDKDNWIRTVLSVKKSKASTTQSLPQNSRIPYITITASKKGGYDKNIKQKKSAEVIGTIVRGHDAAGGNFWLNVGKKKQYTIRYVWELDDATQAQLDGLSESKTKVTVKGTIDTWIDGSVSFDGAEPINIYK